MKKPWDYDKISVIISPTCIVCVSFHETFRKFHAGLIGKSTHAQRRPTVIGRMADNCRPFGRRLSANRLTTVGHWPESMEKWKKQGQKYTFAG